MPASTMPHVETTASAPGGISSIATRVDFEDANDSGVARSSRPGTKRIVNARPTTRGAPGSSGRTPRSQTLRSPLFKSAIVTVAVESEVNAARASSFISVTLRPCSSDAPR